MVLKLCLATDVAQPATRNREIKAGDIVEFRGEGHASGLAKVTRVDERVEKSYHVIGGGYTHTVPGDSAVFGWVKHGQIASANPAEVLIDAANRSAVVRDRIVVPRIIITHPVENQVFYEGDKVNVRVQMPHVSRVLMTAPTLTTHEKVLDPPNPRQPEDEFAFPEFVVPDGAIGRHEIRVEAIQQDAVHPVKRPVQVRPPEFSVITPHEGAVLRAGQEVRLIAWLRGRPLDSLDADGYLTHVVGAVEEEPLRFRILEDANLVPPSYRPLAVDGKLIVSQLYVVKRSATERGTLEMSIGWIPSGSEVQEFYNDMVFVF